MSLCLFNTFLVAKLIIDQKRIILILEKPVINDYKCTDSSCLIINDIKLEERL